MKIAVHSFAAILTNLLAVKVTSVTNRAELDAFRTGGHHRAQFSDTARAILAEAAAGKPTDIQGPGKATPQANELTPLLSPIWRPPWCTTGHVNRRQLHPRAGKPPSRRPSTRLLPRDHNLFNVVQTL
jgi:hypothetical protein